MKTVFTFHIDPGHGWLEVSESGVKSIDMKATDFSDCSYRSGGRLFLEEDCDAPLFLAELRKRGVEYGIVEKYADRTFIRGLPSIHS